MIDDPDEACACGHIRGGHAGNGACLVATTAEQGRRGVHPSRGTSCPCPAFRPLEDHR